MKSFIEIGNLSSNTIQRIIVFFGMLLVFFFVVYFVKKYSISEGMTDMMLGSSDWDNKKADNTSEAI